MTQWCLIERAGVESVSYSTVFKTTEYIGCAIVKNIKCYRNIV